MVAVDRGRYTCRVTTPGRDDRSVVAMRARELRREAIVVGDIVDLVGDTSGSADTLARIVRITPRRSVLRRSADDTDPKERVLVANADILLIVTATADPEPRTGFIDRCLVAAYTGSLQPMLLVTKSDLRDPAELLRAYADLDLPVLISGHASPEIVAAAGLSSGDAAGADRSRRSRFPGPGDVPSPPESEAPAGGAARTYETDSGATDSGAAAADAGAPGTGPMARSCIERVAEPDDAPVEEAPPDDAPLDDDAVAQVRSALTGHMTALIGHSGVGKSTLVNALVPDALRATSAVTGAGKGRHTSSSAVALPLAGGGWIIDTPGVRSFGLAHVTVDDVLESFDDLLPASADCPPGCTHEGDDIGCALDVLVASGGASAGRLASFRRLLASRSEGSGAVDSALPAVD